MRGRAWGEDADVHQFRSNPLFQELAAGQMASTISGKPTPIDARETGQHVFSEKDGYR